MRFDKALADRKLLKKAVILEYNDKHYLVFVSSILSGIERAKKSEQVEIQEVMRKILHNNGDLLHYLKYLALNNLKSKYGG